MNDFPDIRPEPVEDIPFPFTNVVMSMRYMAEMHELTDDQMFWYVYQVGKFVPPWLIALWNGVPELPLTSKYINEYAPMLRAGPPEAKPRYLAFMLKNQIMSETHI
jgi:hypothetical protein